MKLTPAWRNRLRNLTTIFLVLTVVAIIYTFIQWIRSEPGSFEPLNVLFFAVFSVASAISAWLSRPDNVQPPASSEIALAETPAFGPLRQQITNLFSLEELRVLCLDVGIRYDALSGDTIDTKVASLLAYADRRGQLNKLMAALQQERPQAKWPIPNTLQTLYDLRRNVRATWIDGVLRQSVSDEIALELNLTLEPHALTRKVAYVPGQTDKPIEKEVSQLFADFGSLLILGEPGSGKTMTLLQLAENLLNDAEQDATLLTPVVLNLSSWANEQKPLAEWLVEELWQQYQLPREAGRAIIQNNQLIYLLDGLDEVSDAARNACVQAINLFGEQHTSRLVVCCRAKEYGELLHKLNLGLAVRIQPLEKVQVDAYLQRPELELEAVYKLWQTDEELQKLAQTPLFLSVITLAYRGLYLQAEDQLNSEAAWYAHLYRHYVAEMFKRRPLVKEHTFSRDQAMTLLTHLAYGLEKHDQTLFYLERLQPTWLPTHHLQRRYILLVRLFVGLIAGLVAGLVAGLIFELFAGLFIGLFAGLFGWQVGQNEAIKLYETLKWSPPPSELPKKTILGLIKFLIAGLIAGLIIGSFEGLSRWLSGELSDGLIEGLMKGLRFGLIAGPIVGLAMSLFLWLEASIQVPQQVRDPHPNRAILNSLQSGLWMTMFYGLFGWLISWLIGRFGWLISWQGSAVNVGLIAGLCVGLIVGFFRYGGQSFLKHYILRWLLALSDVFPFSAKTDREFIDFLDAMKDRVLLRRVGGGWVFIHRTLLDYFASLHPNAQVEVDHE